MASSNRPFRRTAASGAAVLLGVALSAFAHPVAAQGIYTCIDRNGKRLTSDRPIAECLDREQRVLNRDGSERQRVGPALTPEERARQDEQQRRRLAEESAHRDAARHDRNLLGRYPNREAHDRARANALEPYRKALEAGERRLASLAGERRQLDNEAEFYKGKALPTKLKQQFDNNQASVEAQRAAIKGHADELQRIESLYDDELVRLKQLWAGAAPGSLGPTKNASAAGGR